jgi:hypothetical protein
MQVPIVPIVLVSGVDPDAAAAAMVSLQFDLPDAVSVRHRIDVEAQTLERIVSDVSGLVERTVLEMEHACITCALRDDILPTLVRLAEDGQWRSVVVHMPTGAPAAHVCSVIAHDARLLRLVRVSAAVTVVGATRWMTCSATPSWSNAGCTPRPWTGVVWVRCSRRWSSTRTSSSARTVSIRSPAICWRP